MLFNLYPVFLLIAATYADTLWNCLQVKQRSVYCKGEISNVNSSLPLNIGTNGFTCFLKQGSGQNEDQGLYQPPPLAPREAWNARPSSRPLRNNILPAHTVLLQQTGGEECHVKCMKRVANIQSFEMDAEGLKDISYNFLIGSDGVVYVGRGWYQQGEGASQGTIVIAFIGDFYYQARPNKNQLEAFENLLEMGLNLNLLVEDVVVEGTCDITTPNSSEYLGFKLLLSDRRVPYSQCTDHLVAPGERELEL